jgi:hypothetical protein
MNSSSRLDFYTDDIGFSLTMAENPTLMNLLARDTAPLACGD